MVTMEGSTSPASRSPSPAASASSIEGASVRNSVVEVPPPSAKGKVVPCECRWKGCGRVFANIRSLVDHLDTEHINAHRSSYTCEWASCPRRGLVQASRFALVSHCRSHTGERPFLCQSPDCDKSFTRSDTLAKHMRQKHNISPPAPGRGGHRKRKRSPTPPYIHQPFAGENMREQRPGSPSADGAPSHYNFANRTYAQHPDGRDSGFNTFRVNPPPALPPPRPTQYDARVGVEESAGSSDDDAAVPYNPEVAGGRSKAMVQYLIMKAKYRYVMDENGLLTDELESLRRQEREEWREKEAGVDRVLRVFGPQSEQLIHESEAQPNGKRPDHRMDVDAR